ncbi:integrase family protein [Ruegeria sp. HKCCD9179]|uniref:tyrosine-type recombinase/integrase n=1 Tax=Ruegeria sp. HKCCD9179 TaxID=2683016 RepID=UPI001488F3D2|nr:integrase family protein [Ruegeria sp. HKCCD9179]
MTTKQTPGVVRLRQKPAQPVPLTSTRVRNLKPRTQRYEVRDAQTPGLLVRVFPSGVKSYYLRARVGHGRKAPMRNVRIGSVAEVSLADARAEALRLLALMRQGIDVTDGREAITVAQLIDAYAGSLEARQVVKASDVVSNLTRNLHSHRNRPAVDLTRKHITAQMAALEAAGQQADYFRKCMSGLLTWAVNDGHVPANVLAGYRRAKETRASKLNARVKVTFTTAEEIKAFWIATGTLNNPTHRDLLRFALLTGQRRNETAWITRADVVGGVWTVPAALHKMGEAVKVPLGLHSQCLLDAQQQLAGVGLYFPGRHGKRISGYSQLLRPVRDALGNPDVGFQALRRTYRTGIEELGTPERVCELMIGHKREDLLQRYSEAQLWEQRIDAQHKWEQHVQEVTA